VSEWRAGYLVRTGVVPMWRPTKRVPETKLEELLLALLASPAARLVRELDLFAGSPRTLSRLCAAAATARCARTLRAIELVSGIAAVEPFDCGVLTGLSITTLRTQRAKVHLVGLSALPSLHRLETTVRTAASLRRLLADPAPSLATLALRYEGDQGDGSAEPPDANRLAQLVDALPSLATFAPGLVTLELSFRTPQAADAARAALADLPVQSLTVSPSGAS
jgi:hypothetical protein